MIEATKQFQPDLFRSYLRVLARVELRSWPKLERKVDASDIVQEVLLQGVLALPQFRGSTEPEFAAWLRKILANKLTDAARHFGRQKRDADLEKTICGRLDDSASRLETRNGGDSLHGLPLRIRIGASTPPTARNDRNLKAWLALQDETAGREEPVSEIIAVRVHSRRYPGDRCSKSIRGEVVRPFDASIIIVARPTVYTV